MIVTSSGVVVTTLVVTSFDLLAVETSPDFDGVESVSIVETSTTVETLIFVVVVETSYAFEMVVAALVSKPPVLFLSEKVRKKSRICHIMKTK